MVVRTNDETDAEHFIRFTAKYCLKAAKKQQEDNSMDNICYLLLHDLRRPLSSNFLDKDAISVYLHQPRLTCFSLFLKLELF